jgi:hypothetical protein
VLIRSYTHTNVGTSSGCQVNSKPVACAEKANHVCELVKATMHVRNLFCKFKSTKVASVCRVGVGSFLVLTNNAKTTV